MGSYDQGAIAWWGQELIRPNGKGAPFSNCYEKKMGLELVEMVSIFEEITIRMPAKFDEAKKHGQVC